MAVDDFLFVDVGSVPAFLAHAADERERTAGRVVGFSFLDCNGVCAGFCGRAVSHDARIAQADNYDIAFFFRFDIGIGNLGFLAEPIARCAFFDFGRCFLLVASVLILGG